MDYEQRAKALFLEGYNCAQAVFLAFAEERTDRETATRQTRPESRRNTRPSAI